MENYIDKSGLFRYRIEWKSDIGLTVLFLYSNFDTGSLTIKHAYRYKWVISIQVPYIEISDLYRYKA
jgi:multisubunit Na+/H+ antiporter MnhE subunit